MPAVRASCFTCPHGAPRDPTTHLPMIGYKHRAYASPSLLLEPARAPVVIELSLVLDATLLERMPKGCRKHAKDPKVDDRKARPSVGVLPRKPVAKVRAGNQHHKVRDPKEEEARTVGKTPCWQVIEPQLLKDTPCDACPDTGQAPDHPCGHATEQGARDDHTQEHDRCHQAARDHPHLACTHKRSPITTREHSAVQNSVIRLCHLNRLSFTIPDP